ncbi:hypothetical protein R5R35_010843 [Gryllus longicercus]|uniref:Cytochrome P450 n=1 Tax=Gryllus longicercus TaxID=2509291 RepID=A0AAN9WDS6_9ORTH
MLGLLYSPLTVALTFVTGIVGLLYWWSISTYDYWKKKGVPYEPPTPFFGNIKDVILMRRNFNLVHQDLYNKFEGHRFAGIYQARQPTLFLRDPELIKAVLVRDFNHFHDRGLLIHAEKNPLQQHLFNLPGYRWRVLRNKLSPTFTSGRMKNMFPLVEESSKKLNSFLNAAASKEEIVEMKDILAKFSTDVIGTCAFGLQMNALDDPDSEFRRMGRKVFEPSFLSKFASLTNSLLPEIGRVLKMDDLGRGVSDFFMKVVKETTDYRVKNNVSRNDFLQLLINLKYKGRIDDAEEVEEKANGVNGKNKNVLDFDLDDGLMAAQAFVFFLAGFETSSTTMSFALQELAVHPEIQTKLREEIDDELEKNGGKFTYDSIMNMKYLDKVVSETLRMYPPVQFLVREVTAPYTIPDTKVSLEKGSIVIIPCFAIQRDPKHYPDPERFDPERFSEEEKAKRHHYTYLPFGEGPRNCIGMRFGLLQSKLGLAALLSKYEFHVCERTELPIRMDPKTLVTSSTTGTIVRITHRK